MPSDKKYIIFLKSGKLFKKQHRKWALRIKNTITDIGNSIEGLESRAEEIAQKCKQVAENTKAA